MFDTALHYSNQNHIDKYLTHACNKVHGLKGKSAYSTEWSVDEVIAVNA